MSNYNTRITNSQVPTFICNIVKNYYNSHIFLLNGGMFRIQKTYIDIFTYGDLNELLIYNDFMVTIEILGIDLLNAIFFSRQNFDTSKGGYLHHSDINFKLENDKYYNISTSTLILKGLDNNPHLKKYNNFNLQDGLLLKDIVVGIV